MGIIGGIFGALEEIGRIATGQTDEDKARRQERAAWRNEHRNDYQCKYCGRSSYSISELTSYSCDKSPTGYHIPY